VRFVSARAQRRPKSPRGRARAQSRLPADVRQQLLDAINAGPPFSAVLSDLRLTSNGVGLAKTDEEWATKLEAALAATRRDDLKHGTKCRIRTRLRLLEVSGSTSALGRRDNLFSSPRNEL
jgi:hypothetical protein